MKPECYLGGWTGFLSCPLTSAWVRGGSRSSSLELGYLNLRSLGNQICAHYVKFATDLMVDKHFQVILGYVGAPLSLINLKLAERHQGSAWRRTQQGHLGLPPGNVA